LHARPTRWLEFLSEYDFDIKHIKWNENKVDDELIKRVHEMHATTISIYNSDINDKKLEVVTTNQHYVQIKESLQ
jgi:hypothetical protein